jgi:hypothetical protein
LVYHNSTLLAIAPLSKEGKTSVMIYFVEKRHASLKNEMSFVLDPVQLQTPLVAGKILASDWGEVEVTRELNRLKMELRLLDAAQCCLHQSAAI